MTLDELAATGIVVKPDERSAGTQEEQADAEACSIRGVVGGPENLAIFVESGVITSVGVSSDQGAPRFVTDRGVGLGDSEAAVRRVYGSLKQEADIYGGPRDKKLFHRHDGEHGIKFSIVGGTVNAINVGGGSIEYVEGCS
jgi:hypothetical protein